MASRLILLALLIIAALALFTTSPIRISAQGNTDIDDSDVQVNDDEDDDFLDEDEEEEEGYADEEEEALVDASGRPKIHGPHPDITTFIHFPDYATNNTADTYKFIQGEDIVVLIGFANHALQTYFNVSYIGAQLHSPFDFSYYIQNFTVREVEAIVGPGQETTVEYRFKPDITLEPIEFQLSAWLIYNSSEGKLYQSTIYNNTIELIEKYEPWSLSSIINYALVIAGLGVIGYVGYQLTSGSGTGKKKRGNRRVNGTVVDASGQPVVAAEWSTSSVYTPSSKSKAVKRVGSKKGSKKTDSKKTDERGHAE